MQIHELNNFSGTLGSGAYLAIDDGNDTGKISSQGLLAATEARIDNIIAGDAPSAEEIVDARLGADGVTYASLGTGIRSQFTDVKSALNDTQADVFDAFETTAATTSNNWKLVADTGLCVSDSDYMLVKYAATAGEIYKVECDHLFQFQNSASVPSSAPSKRIGNTFGAGTYYVKAPTGATYLIGSSPKVDSTFKVYKTASRIDSAFNGVIESSTLLYLVGVKDLLVNGYYLNQSGKAVSTSYYKASNYIPVKKGDVIKYNLDSTASTSVLCFYSDASENAFVSYIAGTGAMASGTFTVPSNGFIRIATATSTIDDAYCYVDVNVSPNFVDINEIKTIKSDVLDDNLTLYALGATALLTDGAFLKQNGTTQSNGYYKTSDFIRVKQGQIIKYNLDSNTTTAVLCFYSDKSTASFVSYVAGTASLSSGTYTVPSDGYIKFSTSTASIPSAYCYIEAEPSPNYTKSEYTPVEKTLNVLLLGDSIFGNDGEIAGFLNSMCASCVNGAFGGTRATSRGTGDWQYFDGVNIVQALASQTWTDQDTAVTNLATDYPWITNRLNNLKAVDMSEVDVICMDWGTNDYTSDCTISQITTAYNDIIDTLQTAFPEIRIIICTPIWRCWGDESDNVNGDNHAEFEGGPTLKEIANAIEQFAKDKRISVLNSYQNMPLTYKTRDTYFDAIGSGNTGTSYTHLNVFGNEVYAHLIRGKIVSIC